MHEPFGHTWAMAAATRTNTPTPEHDARGHTQQRHANEHHTPTHTHTTVTADIHEQRWGMGHEQPRTATTRAQEHTWTQRSAWDGRQPPPLLRRTWPSCPSASSTTAATALSHTSPKSSSRLAGIFTTQSPGWDVQPGWLVVGGFKCSDDGEPSATSRATSSGARGSRSSSPVLRIRRSGISGTAKPPCTRAWCCAAACTAFSANASRLSCLPPRPRA